MVGNNITNKNKNTKIKTKIDDIIIYIHMYVMYIYIGSGFFCQVNKIFLSSRWFLLSSNHFM
jgi:hypothetical protein